MGSSVGFEEIEEEIMKWPSSSSSSKLPLLSLNHVSFVCKSVAKSVKFYEDVLGFVLIKRPSSFKFEGAWLFNYGIGIHLLECDNPKPKKKTINPKDNHISFQCSDMKMVMRKLDAMGIEYVTAEVEEGGIKVDQLFFHDPDGYMVEICNCDNLPLLPLSTTSASCPFKTLTLTDDYTEFDSRVSELNCSIQVEALMMESLMMDMMNIAF